VPTTFAIALSGTKATPVRAHRAHHAPLAHRARIVRVPCARFAAPAKEAVARTGCARSRSGCSRASRNAARSRRCPPIVAQEHRQPAAHEPMSNEPEMPPRNLLRSSHTALQAGCSAGQAAELSSRLPVLLSSRPPLPWPMAAPAPHACTRTAPQTTWPQTIGPQTIGPRPREPQTLGTHTRGPRRMAQWRPGPVEPRPDGVVC
jgi:hypothetical protein